MLGVYTRYDPRLTVDPGNERYEPGAFVFGAGHLERIISHENIDLNVTSEYFLIFV